MKGSIVKRGQGFALVIDQGYVLDPKTALKRRKQRWIAFHPTEKHTGQCSKLACSGKCRARQEAAEKLGELIGEARKGTLVEPSKFVLIEYLREWHAKAIAPLKRPKTVSLYKGMIEHVAKSPIAMMPLPRLRASDLEAFYATLKLKPSSAGVCHAVISRALKTAVRDRLIATNPATDVENRPRARKDRHSAEARRHCWTAEEARSFLQAADAASPQLAAWAFLAIDSGARQGELAGLKWSDVDFKGGTVLIERQLDTEGATPTFGPTKTGASRKVSLNSETVARLAAHKRAQAELKMANRTTYVDNELVFAREHEHLQARGTALGYPIRTLGGTPFRHLSTAAGVRRIKPHGLRHTSATLLLNAGVPVQVVAERLGHKHAMMTLEVYAHAMPDMQKDAAARLGAVLSVSAIGR